MGQDCLTVRKAWGVYDRWLRDPKVEFRNEPADVDGLFRRASTPFSSTSAPKALGDCYLLAFSQSSHATLVTFDGALYHLARKADQDAVLLT